MDTIIEIRDLNVYYGNHAAITNVNINFSSHDYVGIIGPNGGGKTSLIKAILGLVSYTGNIEFFGELKNRRNIGYLPQKNNFDTSFPITVKEVIKSGLIQTGRQINNKDSLLKISEVMEITGIKSLSAKAISEISGGELQRTLLCRALISDPQLLILDEPTTFVDNKFEQDLYKILKDINRRMAIIMVSHDLGTISSHVKSIICVNKTAHRHDTNELTDEMLFNYGCPIQLVTHGDIPHTVLKSH